MTFSHSGGGHVNAVRVPVIRLVAGLRVRLYQLGEDKISHIPSQQIDVGARHIRQAVKSAH